MMFSKSCEYAIRASIIIARKSEEGQKVGIKEIARQIESPEHFIAKILQQLSRAGVISSAKGPTGGFYLNEKQLQQPLIDIVKLMDGDSLFTGCGLGLPECSEEKPCPIHEEFGSIRTQITDMLTNTTLEEMGVKIGEGLAFLKRN